MEYDKGPRPFCLGSAHGQRARKTEFVYNSGAVAVVARLIERGVGMPIDTIRRTEVVQSSRIADYEWRRRADGTIIAYSGLRLNIHDLAKIGKLLLQKGKFGGRQIVPAEWLAASFMPMVGP